MEVKILAPKVGDGQGSVACCSPWGHKELDTAEWLNWLNWRYWLRILPNIILTIYVLLTYAAAAATKLLQSCPILCDPIDGSPPGSSVLGILQARTLEWVCHLMHVCMLSRFSCVDSVWPCGQQPTRLLCPQDSLGKILEWVAISFSS